MSVQLRIILQYSTQSCCIETPWKFQIKSLDITLLTSGRDIEKAPGVDFVSNLEKVHGRSKKIPNGQTHGFL